MVYTIPTDKSTFVQTRALINAISLLQTKNIHYARKQVTLARNIITRNNIIKISFIPRIRKIMTQQLNAFYHRRRQLIRPAISVQPSTYISACCPYQREYNYPFTMNCWSGLRSPLYPVSPVCQFYVGLPNRPLYAANYRPFMGNALLPLLSPVVSQNYVQENVSNGSNYTNEFDYSTEHIDVVDVSPSEESYYTQEEVVGEASSSSSNTMNSEKPGQGVDQASDTNVEVQPSEYDLIESYLNLPQELFPSPRLCRLDPNSIIDEFCKLQDIVLHAPWLLDLEFGIPKTPAARPLPIYDVKFNSIRCKNDPDTIHPVFAKCNSDFKRVLLFYFDCIVSGWYRGYTIMNGDDSVKNFESWLLTPMQALGIGWP